MYFPVPNLISIFSLLPESKKSVVATAALGDDNGRSGKKNCPLLNFGDCVAL